MVYPAVPSPVDKTRSFELIKKIPFNRPFIIGDELDYIADAVTSGHLAGDGKYTRKCHAWLEERFGGSKALLTHSCTGALEMAAILADVEEGDEFIVPSYTFVSTVNAFMLRGAKPVFVDIREDTLNMDEQQVEPMITPRTKAIVPVHYAGVGCDMDSIMAIADRRGLLVVEDAAQAVNASYKGRWLGAIGHLGCYSFHETKNFISGEGGALMINDERFIERAEIVREKGTNRSKFFRGEVDKYTWVDIGSSYLPSELVAAFLYAQLEHADEITERRLSIWQRYRERLQCLEDRGVARLPRVPKNCVHNGHMFYLLMNSEQERDDLIRHLRSRNIHAVFHYVPLHSSPMGRRLGITDGQLTVTDRIANRLVRLPCFHGLTCEDQERVASAVLGFFD